MKFTSTEVRFEHGLFKYIATLCKEGYCIERYEINRSSMKLKLPVGTLYSTGWYTLRTNAKNGYPVYFKTLDDIKEYLTSSLEKKLDFLTLPRMMVAR